MVNEGVFKAKFLPDRYKRNDSVAASLRSWNFKHNGMLKTPELLGVVGYIADQKTRYMNSKNKAFRIIMTILGSFFVFTAPYWLCISTRLLGETRKNWAIELSWLFKWWIYWRAAINPFVYAFQGKLSTIFDSLAK